MANIEQILKGLDPQKMAQHIGGIDPFKVLSELGFDKPTSDEILKGNASLAVQNNPSVLDFHKIIHTYGQAHNSNLIQFFYKKAKNGESFTDEEVLNYGEAFSDWFNLVFQVGSMCTFQLDEESEDTSLLIKVNDDYFHMFQVDDVNQIIYLGENLKL